MDEILNNVEPLLCLNIRFAHCTSNLIMFEHSVCGKVNPAEIPYGKDGAASLQLCWH